MSNSHIKSLAIAVLCALLIMGATLHQTVDVGGSVSPTQGKMYVYNLNTYSNLYARFYNTKLDQLWDSNASAMGSAATVTWANSDVAMTDHESTRGGWLIPVPAVTDGWYDVLIYDNAVPASSDTVLLGKHCYIQGGMIQTMDSL